MNKKKVRVTGINDVDTEEMKRVRETVIEQELSARSWKAWWEKMYYTIECEKIQPLYDETKARMDKKAEDAKAQFEQFKKNLAIEIEKQNGTDPMGELQVEGLSADNPIKASDLQLGEMVAQETLVNTISGEGWGQENK